MQSKGRMRHAYPGAYMDVSDEVSNQSLRVPELTDTRLDIVLDIIPPVFKGLVKSGRSYQAVLGLRQLFK